MQATLNVERPRRFMNALRSFRVLLDGADVFRLANGERLSTARAAQ